MKRANSNIKCGEYPTSSKVKIAYVATTSREPLFAIVVNCISVQFKDPGNQSIYIYIYL